MWTIKQYMITLITAMVIFQNVLLVKYFHVNTSENMSALILIIYSTYMQPVKHTSI